MREGVPPRGRRDRPPPGTDGPHRPRRRHTHAARPGVHGPPIRAVGVSHMRVYRVGNDLYASYKRVWHTFSHDAAG